MDEAKFESKTELSPEESAELDALEERNRLYAATIERRDEGPLNDSEKARLEELRAKAGPKPSLYDIKKE